MRWTSTSRSTGCGSSSSAIASPPGRARRWAALALGPLAIGLLALDGSRALAQAELDVGGAGDAEILRQIDAVTAEVVELRGLAPRAPIPAGLHSRESLRQVLLQEIAEEWPIEEIRAEEAVLRRLGLLGAETDYYELVVGLLQSQIAGFYDDEQGQLFLLDDIAAQTQTPTLAHELFHGIQDQLFSIGSVRADWDRADDALIAASALIEGDATGVMIDYTLAEYGISFSDVPNFRSFVESQVGAFEQLAAAAMPRDVPQFLKEELLFPYFEGLRFVYFMKAAGEWEAVNLTYRDPPLSSEQVLHPERYLDRDRPTWIELQLGELAEMGYRQTYDQVWGEFHWGGLFRQMLPDVAEQQIEDATVGWDGDRLLAFEGPDGALLLVLLSVWDSAQDASDFADVARRWLEVRDGEGMVEVGRGPHGGLWAVEGAGGWVAVERWGDMVMIIDGAGDWAGVNGQRLREWAWRGRERGEYVRPEGHEGEAVDPSHLRIPGHSPLLP